MSFVVATPGRLVDVAKQHLAVVPIDEVGPLIAGGRVQVDGRAGAIDDRVEVGAVLATDATGLLPEPCALPIAYEDDALVIVDKPHGMHVHPLGEFRTGTLLNAMLWHAGARADRPWAAYRPSPAHRLDRGASGLVAFAKTAAAHDDLRGQLASGALHRRYRATVEGRLAGQGVIDHPLGRDPANDYRRAVVAGGQRAVTRYVVVEDRGDRTVVELELETGRTHQIRAHLASLGHPIVGDRLYGAAAGEPPDEHRIELRAIAFGRTHAPT
ncbi:MAG TPA: RluA family pseudouridine synthase [Kofleriaceae bacterium]|nr:RluA family pseudouridine synthase [Kofleriaceae bacterium]